ncbi:hypothetical protein [Lacticaseibacillus absianus]|uniref:hypothetical protein n=1 Tax=Lacticaseibacillus absianus TaxID=2729623 RepID=UPI0015CB2C43|nr:hypothetical protein [Lacticaseibacillus absianus]
MRWHYYLVQLRLLLQRKKNLAAIGLALIAVAAYCFYYNERTLPPERIDLTTLRNETKDTADYLKANGDATLYPATAGRARIDARLLQGITHHDREVLLNGYTARLANYLMGNSENYLLPLEYYLNPKKYEYVDKDGRYYINQTQARVTYYSQHARVPVDVAVLNQQTFLQTLVRLTAAWLPLGVLILCLALGNDMVTDDWQHQTVSWGQPLRWRTRLRLKTLAVLTVVALIVIVAVGAVAAVTLPRYGLGRGAMVVQHYGRFMSTRLISQTQYLAEFTLLLLVASWLMTRLTLAIQLLLGNEYIALILGGVFLLLPQAYYMRGIGFVKPWVTWLMPSYTQLGSVVSGEMSYRYDAQVMTTSHALLVMGLWLIGIELVVSVCIARRRQRGWLA